MASLHVVAFLRGCDLDGIRHFEDAEHRKLNMAVTNKVRRLLKG